MIFSQGNIVNAIKACDSKRPVISDMHGLGVDNAWRIKDQAECCDILTTHPYPHFVPHCFKDGMNSFRTLMHVPCENKYYSEIGGKPCFTEEIGILGPMTCDEETAVAFLKSSAYQAFINGQPGFMWWCAYEQSHLETAPYSWIMMERELGLMDKMDKKGVVINSAFCVSGAFILGSHLAFTMAFDSSYIVPVIVGKLVSGVFSVIVANFVFNRTNSKIKI